MGFRATLNLASHSTKIILIKAKIFFGVLEEARLQAEQEQREREERERQEKEERERLRQQVL